MLTPLLFAYAAVRGQATPPPTASGLISKMFARYYGAKTLGGTVRTTQVAGQASVITDTHIAYERPSKLFLDQRQTVGDEVKEKMLVSDGNVFQYTPPEQIITTTPFLKELVHPVNHDAQKVGDLYLVVASNLPDRSPVLDALIGRRDDLRYFQNQLATFHLAGKETIGGRVANLIEGDWRETERQFNTGRFKLYVTDEGDLVRYILTQKFALPAAGSTLKHTVKGGDAVNIVTTWDASLAIDQPLKPGTFALRP